MRQKIFSSSLTKWGGKLLCIAVLSLSSLRVNAQAQPAPSNPNASQATKNVLSYLESISGNNILSGQQENSGDPNAEWNTIANLTGGKHPGTYILDFSWNISDSARQAMVQAAIDKWQNQKVLIGFSWHTCPPTFANDDCSWGDINQGRPSSLIDQVLTSGTPENTVWMARIDRVAKSLQQLQAAGVPVMFRPFHEMNGGWFWWGSQPRFNELWVQLYNRLVNYNKLNNLLFVWSPNALNSGPWPDSYYPGDNYVDILGQDVYLEYGHQFSQESYNWLLQKANGKPIAICENGTLPDISVLMQSQPKYVYFNTWAGWEGSGQNGLISQYFNNPRTTNAGGVNLSGGVAASSGGSNNTPQTLYINAGGATLTGKDGTNWVADEYFDGGSTADRGNITVQGDSAQKSDWTERYGMNGYHILLANGTYKVTLDFAETYNGITGAGQRVFDANVGGTTISNIDPFGDTGGLNIEDRKQVTVNVTNGKLDITFTSHVQSPEINGIEILPSS